MPGGAMMQRLKRIGWLAAAAGMVALGAAAGQGEGKGAPAPLDGARQAVVRQVDAMAPELAAMNQDLWGFAELGLEERRSAARLTGALEKAGFRVKRGVSGMPTAFVAEYGSGRPVIGLLAEYDALPDLSQ